MIPTPWETCKDNKQGGKLCQHENLSKVFGSVFNWPEYFLPSSDLKSAGEPVILAGGRNAASVKTFGKSQDRPVWSMS